MFKGKTHYFNGHFQWLRKRLPEGILNKCQLIPTALVEKSKLGKLRENHFQEDMLNYHMLTIDDYGI